MVSLGHSKTSLNWQFSERLLCYRSVVALLVLVAAWVAAGFIYLPDRPLSDGWQSWLIVLSVVSLGTISVSLWLDFVKPLQHLRSWLLDIHAGDLSSRMPETEGSGFNVFCRDLNSMAHMLESQSRYGVVQLQRHTDHMADKTRMQEREWIAYELHDSLAQTIGGLRFQARALARSLRSGDEDVRQHLDKVEGTLKEASLEIRGLINYFHTTSRLGALEQSVDGVISRFRSNNPGIRVFFHKTWPSRGLPREFEIQVLKIIQEALANVHKHARASLVRVMMRGTGDGHYRVLIEDNGVGMDTSAGDSDKHIGMAAMRSRAARIRSSLSFESKPGEGTRVALDFSVGSPHREREGEFQDQRSKVVGNG